MSRDITPLGQHTLNFNDRKVFMSEIANRFQANVYFGFLDSYNLVKDDLPTFTSLGIENPYKDIFSAETYLLDIHIISESAPPFVLLNEDYIYQWLYEKYGEAAGNQKEFKKSWRQDPIDNNKTIELFRNASQVINFCFKNTSGFISKEAVSVGFDEYFTYWDYLLGFISKTDYDFQDDFYESFLHYRNTNKETVRKFGGNCIYYHDDQGNNTGGSVQGNEWDMSWIEIETSFNKLEVKNYQINLCEALTNPEYLAQIQPLVYKHSRDYSVIYDDFRELELSDLLRVKSMKYEDFL